MAEMTLGEPQSAADYDDRTTTAVKTVLIEIGQILGSFKGKFAIVGGAVQWLLLGNEDMPHVGTLDVDLGLDAQALGDGEYATLVEALQGHGYQQRRELRRFQLVRQIATEDGGAPIDVIVDFLMPRNAEFIKNVPPLISDFAVQRADGADLALRFYQLVAITGPMPAGGTNRVEIAVCSIPALLAMKGHAIEGSVQAEGRLRHLLLRPELPRRSRGPCRGVPSTACACQRRGGLRLHCRQVRYR